MDTLKTLSSVPYQGQTPAAAARQSTDVAGIVAAPTAPVQVKLDGKPGQESKQQISSAVSEINNFFQMAQRSLSFSLDESSGKMVMQITDTETHEVIRQIPSEDVLKLAKHLDELTGVLFKAQA
jgi:flagellar protein FlaG